MVVVRPSKLRLTLRRLPRLGGHCQAKMLKCAGNDDVITMKADDNGDTVTFMFENKGACPRGRQGAAARSPGTLSFKSSRAGSEALTPCCASCLSPSRSCQTKTRSATLS